MAKPGFTFIDLFAGIGGFHAALSAMGGKCVLAVEIDSDAANVYKQNWGIDALGDITKVANDDRVDVPNHDILCAGFPCQPFSKSGAQKGMDETRGTLYWNILRIIQTKQPAIVLLENVRNLTGPRHRHEWQVIIETLRAEGYRVSETPAIFSPHLLPAEMGGRPQIRERVFITATRVPPQCGLSLDADPVVLNRPIGAWDPSGWHLQDDLPLDEFDANPNLRLTDAELHWIDAWDDFVQMIRRERPDRRLPGFPIWADEWTHRKNLKADRLASEPKWKADFLRKNSEFYTEHRSALDKWTKKWKVYSDYFPASRRKFEWQAQDTPRLWDTVMHFRPSGIRAKAPTYLPALVAITQTSIIGPLRRRLSPREAARLQGLPDWFSFGHQSDSSSYKQLGNGVSVGAVWHVLRTHVARDEEILKVTHPRLLRTILSAPPGPDSTLAQRLVTPH